MLFLALGAFAAAIILRPKLQPANNPPTVPTKPVPPLVENHPESTVDKGDTTRPKDIYGWDKVRWGMSFAEVLAIYGPSAKRGIFHDPIPALNKQLQEQLGIDLKLQSPRPFAYLTVSGLAEYGEPVDIEMRCLNCTEERVTSLLIVASYPGTFIPQQALFTRWLEGLSADYGPPKERHTKESPISLEETVTWRYPSTNIDLMWEEPNPKREGSIRIRFQQGQSPAH